MRIARFCGTTKVRRYSVGTAFVFPVVLRGALWGFGLDGIWFNFVGVNVLAAILSVILLGRLMKEIAKREKETL